jgi:hypothetical protein
MANAENNGEPAAENTQAGKKADKKAGKRERDEARRRAARGRALKQKGFRYSGLALVILIPTLWTYDRSGSEIAVDATVILTQQYQHYNEKSGAHTHLRATLLVDGKSEHVVERADNYQRGQKVKVWVRKGRITGWPYFNDMVKPGEDVPDAEADVEAS